MALRQLLLTRELAALKEERVSLETASAALSERRIAWEAREAAAVAAFRELNGSSTEEERTAFDAEAAEIEAERTALEAEEAANTTRMGEVDTAIVKKTTELETLNKRAHVPKPKTSTLGNHTTNRKDYNTMERREAIRAMVGESEEVRAFLNQIKETRGITNANYTIPTVMLPVLRQATETYSKLAKYISVSDAKGEADINMLGAAPEAVWTETSGAFNELDLSLSQISVGAHKVAGYVPIPNAYLEDSDENLAYIIVDVLAQSIGYARDKAYIYGTGTKMPVGIVTRLAASTQPSWWNAKAGAFVALNTTNIGKLSASTVTGNKLFAEMAKVLGRAKEVYRNGTPGKFWAMASTTWMQLKTELLTTNAAGALLTSVGDTMPVIGGGVEILDFIPDGDVIGGYGSQYKYVNRGTPKMKQSEHVKFLDDQTVYVGVERGDGEPIAGEGFAAFNIKGNNVTTQLTFADDSANTVADEE